ncbi:MAG: glycosyltransferase [Anaerolineae bacterium]
MMDWVFFSSISWDDQGGAHRPTQLARALASQIPERRRSPNGEGQGGHRVLFVQVLPAGTPATEPGIRVISLDQLGLGEAQVSRAWYGVENPAMAPVADNLARRLAEFERVVVADPRMGADSRTSQIPERGGADRRVAVWTIPFAPFVGLFPLLRQRGYTTVYDCIDDFSGAGETGSYFASPDAEAFLASACDRVIGLSQPLVDKWERVRRVDANAPVELVPDGADPHFRARGPAPDDLLRGEITLGFWGTINDYMVDAEALAQVAHARPDWAFNLIGKYDEDPARPSVAHALRGLPNVRLLGHRPHETLMDYLAGLDVCLLPFPNNAFSRGRDPIKVYEYLAGYKPVAALNTPQLAGLPFTFVTGAPEEWMRAIETAKRTPVDRAVVDQFLARNSWAMRAARLVEIVSRVEPWGGAAQEIGMPGSFHNPGEEPARIRAYMAHLEKAAEERQAYARRLEEELRRTDAYIKKLERTHPLLWLKRVWEMVTRAR